jgi:uncharacterized protein (TIGR03435 family)
MSRFPIKLLAVAIVMLARDGHILDVAAQSAATFDAVSIKRNHSGAAASDTNTTPGRLNLINVTPISLVWRAFGLLNPQIANAPSWTSSERYDVIAVTGGGDALTDKDRQPFLRAMLAERWQFRFHWETKNLRVYSLVVGKNGSKLVSHTGPGEYAMKLQPEGNHLILRSTKGNVGRLVEILSGQTSSLVINDTGLSGEYDFTLEWAQDQNADATGPSLFTALQEQLGLRLESTRKPMPVVVIDHIERPSEN